MTQYGYALLGLTVIVAVLVGVLMIAALKLAAGLRGGRRRLQSSGGDTGVLSAALQEAMTRLKEQERATSARADASEQLATHIVESLSAGLLVVDNAGRVEILNPAGRALLGVDADPVGTDYRELLAPARPLSDAIAECLSVGQSILRRTVEVSRQDRVVHLGLSVSPLGGDPSGVICLFSDLTAVIELEEQLRLKEALASVGELTAGMAHEFRNGLATIHGYSRLLNPDALPPAQQPYVEGIRRETEALGRVVTNFLNFARPEQVSLASVDLEALVKRAGDDLHHELPAGTAIELTGDYVEIQGDEVLLRQLFGNLLRNAAEACEAAGVTPAIVVDGSVDRTRGVCSVSVTDNGPGISREVRDRIFQPFVTTRSAGTGLGLAIVQKIVVTHNGRVSAGMSPRGGARFDVTFPLSGPPAIRRR